MPRPMDTEVPLNEPVAYAPYESGRYDVGPGLLRLGHHRVHGRLESHVFSFDAEYAKFIAAKVESRRRGLHLYYQQAALAPSLRTAVLNSMLGRLEVESDGGVTWDGGTLRNRWLGWAIRLDPHRGSVEDVRTFPAPLAEVVDGVVPLDALDALAMNVQEDFAVVARDPVTLVEWQAALHVCLPQHWDPRDKVGRSFAAVHEPVVGAGPMIASAARIVEATITRGPFLRFAWGISTSARLDHHPAAPPDGDREDSTFHPDRTFVRVERQTLHGFPEAHGAFFTIRPYVYPLGMVARDAARRAQLARALRSMSDEQLAYKGLVTLRAPLVDWLETGPVGDGRS